MKLREVLLAVLFTLVPLSNVYAAKYDVLELPAVPSELASKSLIFNAAASFFLPDGLIRSPISTVGPAAVIRTSFVALETLVSILSLLWIMQTPVAQPVVRFNQPPVLSVAG